MTLKVAYFRFYEELNDFLPAARKKKEFSYSFDGNPSVKDLIESLGIPHPEIDLILANGKSVDFRYKPGNGDHISVYPVFESLDITPVTHLRKKPLRIVKFISDVHLGKLVKYLRLLGFDTYFDTNKTDNEIIDISLSEKRIILTRDRQLLKNNRVTHGYWIRSSDPGEQIREVVKRLDLRNIFQPFTRCMECNGILANIKKEEIYDLLQPGTRANYDDFMRCRDCNHIYWKGSHYDKMKKTIENIPE